MIQHLDSDILLGDESVHLGSGCNLRIVCNFGVIRLRLKGGVHEAIYGFHFAYLQYYLPHCLRADYRAGDNSIWDCEEQVADLRGGFDSFKQGKCAARFQNHDGWI